MFSHSELSNLFIDKRIMFVNPLINEMKIKIRGFYLSAILTWVANQYLEDDNRKETFHIYV